MLHPIQSCPSNYSINVPSISPITLNGPLLIIGRQVPTDLGKSIDLLGVDREGNVVVVELKRDRTPRDVVAQALEYAAFAAKLDAGALEGILGEYRPDEPLGWPSNTASASISQRRARSTRTSVS